MTKIKWNWGTKLALWITAFIVFMLILVFMTMRNNIMLVEKDYYPKGLDYQSRIDELENAQLKNASFLPSQENDSLQLKLSNVVADSGTLVFFRPSDNSLDRSYPFNSQNNHPIRLPLTHFKPGKYILKAQWYYKNTPYYREQIIFIK